MRTFTAEGYVFRRRLTETQLLDVNYMSAQMVQTYYRFAGWAQRPEEILVTVMHRLAHLISRMERIPSDGTDCCARWFLANMDRVYPKIPTSDHHYVRNHAARLQRAVDAYENRVGYHNDPDFFGRLVYDNPDWVLFGPIGSFASPVFSSSATSTGVLYRALHYYCWPMYL